MTASTEDVTIPGVQPRRLQVVRPLVTVLPESARGEVLKTLGARSERPSGSRYVLRPLLEALLDLRRRGDRAISLKELSVRFSARAKLGGDDPVTPRWIGGLLRRSLELTPVKRNGVYVLPSTTYSQIDELARLHNIEVDVGDDGDEIQGGTETA